MKDALALRDARDPRRGTRRALVRALGIAIPLVSMLVSGAASAQDHEVDAERLFREGQKLLEERRFGEACPKFEAAYSKDHSLGTLINLAFCHKEQGAVWYAWLEFREAEVKATELNRTDRRDFAKQQLTELEKQLPKVIIDNPQKLPLSGVLVEDRKVWEAERGAVFAAEVGQRRFIFKAKGKKDGVVLVNIVKGDKVQHVTVPDMEDGSDEPPPKPEVAPAPPKTDVTPPPESTPGSTQRTLGWVALGVGGVAAVVGAIEGVSTLSSPCAGGKTCQPDERSSASTTGSIADVSLVIAAIGIGGGIALIVTAPSGSQVTPPASAARAAPFAPPRRGAGVTLTPHLGLGWASVSGTF